MMVSNIHARKHALHRNLSRRSQKREKIQILVINLTLTVALIGYSFIGAGVFVALEHDNEMKEYDNLNKARQQLVEEIVNMTQLAIDDGEMEENITEIVLGRLDRFEEEFIRAACTHHVDRKGKAQWNLYSSLFFSATVISMIGE